MPAAAKGSATRATAVRLTTCRRLTKAINDPNAPIEIISATSDDLFKDPTLGRNSRSCPVSTANC